MTRRMFRYEVPVDDQHHTFDLVSNISVRHVAAAAIDVVEFWAEDYDGVLLTIPRHFQVFGTGQPLPEGASWCGTCQRLPNGLVWHLYEVAS